MHYYILFLVRNKRTDSGSWCRRGFMSIFLVVPKMQRKGGVSDSRPKTANRTSPRITQLSQLIQLRRPHRHHPCGIQAAAHTAEHQPFSTTVHLTVGPPQSSLSSLFLHIITSEASDRHIYQQSIDHVSRWWTQES